MPYVAYDDSFEPAFHVFVTTRDGTPMARITTRGGREIVNDHPLDKALRMFWEKERSLLIAVTLEGGALWPKTAPPLVLLVPA